MVNLISLVGFIVRRTALAIGFKFEGCLNLGESVADSERSVVVVLAWMRPRESQYHRRAGNLAKRSQQVVFEDGLEHRPCQYFFQHRKSVNGVT